MDSHSEKTPPFVHTLASIFTSFWPLVFGLAFAFCGILMTDSLNRRFVLDGIEEDIALLITSGILCAFLLVLLVRKQPLSKHTVHGVMVGSIAIQIVAVSALCVFPNVQNGFTPAHMVLYAVSQASDLFIIFYWLRYMRGSSILFIIAILLLGMILSEIIMFACIFIPRAVLPLIIVCIAASQIVLVRMARKRPTPYEKESNFTSGAFADLVKHNISSNIFLVNIGLSIGFMAVVVGLLKGYPGSTADFSLVTRFFYLCLLLGICIAIIWGVAIRANKKIVSEYAWIAFQILACGALILYTTFPYMSEFGALTVAVLNAMLVMYIFYAVVAFMGYGWRDPYYYAITGVAIFLILRASSHIIESLLFSAGVINASQVIVAIACCLIASSQVVFHQLLRIPRAQKVPESQMEHVADATPQPDEPKSHLIEKLMGIDNESAVQTLGDVRLQAMRRDVERMGKQFLLSQREIDVLALYAMGHTQQKVAEELCISPGTVHAHIKRIYAKTGFHSRQSIIDYLKKY